MGSGKSTLGKKLARLLGCPFTDLDVLIQDSEKKNISDIFKEHGETYFRSLENKYLNKIVRNSEKPSVVAMGGGTVCFHSNLELAKKNGILVYVDMPAKALYERIKRSKTERPLLKNIDPSGLESHIESLLLVRSSFYEQAHIKISGLNLTSEFLHQAILAYKDQNIL